MASRAARRAARGALLAALALAVCLAVALPAQARPAGAAPDPRWHFYTADHTRYVSPWFAGARRIMVPYGCTRAPYYAPDRRCRGGRGFHHGIDVAMPCGTRLYAASRGVVLRRSAPGTPGPAYGRKPFRIRTQGHDVLIGHARRVLVRPGDRVVPGQLIARASDSGAPDGCHLHFEVRRKGTGYTGAVNPRRYLRLTPVAR